MGKLRLGGDWTWTAAYKWQNGALICVSAPMSACQYPGVREEKREDGQGQRPLPVDCHVTGTCQWSRRDSRGGKDLLSLTFQARVLLRYHNPMGKKLGAPIWRPCPWRVPGSYTGSGTHPCAGAQFLQGVVSAPFEPSMRVQERRVTLSLPWGHTGATAFLGTED